MEKSTREGNISRHTSETKIELKLALDGQGQYDIACGVGFLEHMLTLFAVHGSFDLQLAASGDTHIDDHHTVEDIGICLGAAISQALGDKSGISRYGCCYLPMDETLVRVVIDISNRPYLHFNAPITEQKIGSFDSCLAKEFFRAVSQHAGVTLHIDLLHGENGHHIIEAIFKAFARALRQGVTPLDRPGVMSSKGSL